MSDVPDTPHSFQEIAVARVEVDGPIINMIQFKRHFEEHIVGLRNLGCVPDAKKAIRNLRELLWMRPVGTKVSCDPEMSTEV